MSTSNKFYENYKKIKLLDRGSFGKAYLVECESDKTFAVIKNIDIDKMTEDERKTSLMESKILEKLKHPNIIRFREVYKSKKGKLCIVMDYAEGGDLEKKISNRKEYFYETQILDYFVQICLAIKHIHDRKVLHRDLKSQNIFLTSDNMVKLGDFGIAKMLNNTNQMVNTTAGTPYYYSPEIVEGKQYSFKSDIWSMGVVLYEMCTLKSPFEGHNLQKLQYEIVKGKYTPIPIHYSEEMKNLVTAMLSYDPSNRPRVHEILKMPIIKDRIKDFLTKTQQNVEFEHTVIHNKDLTLIYAEEQQKYSSNGYEDEYNFKHDSKNSKYEDYEIIKYAEIKNIKEQLYDECRHKRYKEKSWDCEIIKDKHKRYEQTHIESMNLSRVSNQIGRKYSLSPKHSMHTTKYKNVSSVNSNSPLDKRDFVEKIEQLQREMDHISKINDVKINSSDKNKLNRVDKEKEFKPTYVYVKPESNYLESKSSRIDNIQDNLQSEYVLKRYKSCDINENVLNLDDMKAMNECMMKIYLKNDEKQQYNQDNDDKGDYYDQYMLTNNSSNNNYQNINQYIDCQKKANLLLPVIIANYPTKKEKDEIFNYTPVKNLKSKNYKKNFYNQTIFSKTLEFFDIYNTNRKEKLDIQMKKIYCYNNKFRQEKPKINGKSVINDDHRLPFIHIKENNIKQTKITIEKPEYINFPNISFKYKNQLKQ